MRQPSILHAIVAGLIAAFVGFASSFPVVVQGLKAIGASDGEAASGLMALSIAMGVAGMGLSFYTRMPISVAWSTPGAALLSSTGAISGGFPAAVGAFIIVALLLIAAGLVRPLGRAVAAIPSPLANAMLAGVLFSLCLAPVKAMVETPAEAAAIIIVWLVVARWKRLYATPAAAVIAALLIALLHRGTATGLVALTPQALLITPSFSLSATISLALPLFIVTMASQNIPGLAVLTASGYRPNPSLLIAVTGFFSLMSAPFGGHAVNLAAITAALCASPDAHPDPTKRWIAAAAGGATYVIFFGLLAGAVTSVVAGSPILVEAVAGLALLGAFGSALGAALGEADAREAALATFLTTASGVTFFGVGGAFWGLVAGGAILALSRAGLRLRTSAPAS
jgi:benzoate membrane transport protein